MASPDSNELDSDELRAYAHRDWGAVERLARRDRARQSVSERVGLAIELYEACRRTRPEWPTEADRRADLDAHRRLKAKLQQAAHVGRR